jgi:hypothetical protein
MIVQFGGSIDIGDVVMENLQHYPVNGRNWSGVFNAIDAEVKFSRLRVADAPAEDAVNFVNSTVLGDYLEIHNSRSDALDVDFGTMKIATVSCHDVGNDCLDTSGVVGTVALVNGVGVGDKLISAGEGSRLAVARVQGEQVGIGVVSKDSSALQIDSLSLVATDLSGAVFRKKTQFSEAQLTIGELELTGHNYNFLVDDPANFSYSTGGAEITSRASEEIEGLMYGAVYGKATER